MLGMLDDVLVVVVSVMGGEYAWIGSNEDGLAEGAAVATAFGWSVEVVVVVVVGCYRERYRCWF
jgi:hypothetical protein